MSQESQPPSTHYRYGLHFKPSHNPVNPPNLQKTRGGRRKHTYAKVTGGDRSIGLIQNLTSVFHKPQSTASHPQPVHTAPSQPSVQGTKRALLIGINYIGSDNALNGCINDIHTINGILTAHYNFLPENITMLSDDQQGDNKPTRVNILAHFDKVVALTKPGDELFIQYSGHGTQVPCPDHDEDLNPETPGQDDALCPCDFDDYDGDTGFILDDLLREKLVDPLPVGAKLRVFVDACHSGSMLDLPFLFKKGEEYVQVEPLDKQSPDCLLISGCKDFQTSADAYINKQYSGALTWAISQALTSSKEIPTSWKDFLYVVRHLLYTKKYTQIPMLSVGDKKLADEPIDL